MRKTLAVAALLYASCTTPPRDDLSNYLESNRENKAVLLTIDHPQRPASSILFSPPAYLEERAALIKKRFAVAGESLEQITLTYRTYPKELIGPHASRLEGNGKVVTYFLNTPQLLIEGEKEHLRDVLKQLAERGYGAVMYEVTTKGRQIKLRRIKPEKPF
jgi:hypothetical protein